MDQIYEEFEDMWNTFFFDLECKNTIFETHCWRDKFDISPLYLFTTIHMEYASLVPYGLKWSQNVQNGSQSSIVVRYALDMLEKKWKKYTI